MRKIAILCALLYGCDPEESGPVSVSVRFSITNEYADSIFSLDVDNKTLFTEKRLRILETAVSDKIESTRDSQLTFKIKAMSLGAWNEFEPITISAKYGTYDIAYEYDLARAKFSIAHGWKSNY